MPISNQDLRKAGLKVTLPRIKILELLENSKQHHLSAEDIYKTLLEQGEDVGLATVYRVLTQFEAAGLFNVIILKIIIQFLKSCKKIIMIT
jgi:Fur family ferric uptake transcriptional regulator